MYSETPSGARPMLSRAFRYAVFQPDSFSLSDSSISSVTLSVGKPPTCCSASRRVTEEVPQQNATPQASLEASSTSKKKRCSSGHLLATDLLIPERRQRAAEELRLRDKIGIENGDEFARFLARKLPQCVVDVTRLRMLIARARDVP